MWVAQSFNSSCGDYILIMILINITEIKPDDMYCSLLFTVFDIPRGSTFSPWYHQEKATSCTSAQPLLKLVTERCWKVSGFTPNLAPSVCSSSSTTAGQPMTFSTSGFESMTKPSQAVNWDSSRVFQVIKIIEYTRGLTMYCEVLKVTPQSSFSIF